MFTGLIEATGEVTARTPTTGGQRISVRSPLTADLNLGDSVAVNGVCLTVVQTDGAFHADVGPETLRVTTLGSLAAGAVVNLERPLRGDGRMGGHFVQGHVDAIGRIEKLQPASDFLWMTVSFPHELARFPVGAVGHRTGVDDVAIGFVLERNKRMPLFQAALNHRRIVLVDLAPECSDGDPHVFASLRTSNFRFHIS